jgi:hypothetical protein
MAFTLRLQTLFIFPFGGTENTKKKYAELHEMLSVQQVRTEANHDTACTD